LEKIGQFSASKRLEIPVEWTSRRYPDKSGDYRTQYERDYARIVHSASFRRLQAKTQVLGVGDGDFYRTRLTHTLEVSQIGVSITKKLYREAENRKKSGMANGDEMDLLDAKLAILPDPMLMSSICLAHDIGHPPFGHGGEVALNRCMLPYGGFEGNGQTLRIITKLDRYHQNGGMNLTKRTVLGTIKYPVRFSDAVNWSMPGLGGQPKAPEVETKGNLFLTRVPQTSIFVAEHFKPPKCYLDDEHDDVVMGWVRQGLEDDWDQLSTVYDDDPGKKHPKPKFMSLDTSIMELADDIAYGVHDLEDAIGLHLIDEKSFCSWLEGEDAKTSTKRKELLAPYLAARHAGELPKMIKALFSSKSHERKIEISSLVGFFVDAARLRSGPINVVDRAVSE
jgi:dGTPase